MNSFMDNAMMYLGNMGGMNQNRLNQAVNTNDPAADYWASHQDPRSFMEKLGFNLYTAISQPPNTIAQAPPDDSGMWMRGPGGGFFNMTPFVGATGPIKGANMMKDMFGGQEIKDMEAAARAAYNSGDFTTLSKIIDSQAGHFGLPGSSPPIEKAAETVAQEAAPDAEGIWNSLLKLLKGINPANSDKLKLGNFY